MRPSRTRSYRYLNWSAREATLVPPGIVTVTLTDPAVIPMGLRTVILAGLTTVTPGASFVPKRILAPRTKSAPVMVTTVPPRSEPSRGDTEVTRGAM